MKRKMTSVFSWQVWGCNYPHFTVGKYFICHQATTPRFKKNFSLQFQSCIKTLLAHNVTLHQKRDKRSRESVLWVLTAIPVVTLIRWNYTVRWLTKKKWQAAWFSQKTQEIDHICGDNEGKNEPACFSGKFKAAIIQLSLGGNTCFATRPQFPGSQKHVFWLFQCGVKIHPGQIVQVQKKRCQERMLCECELPYLLLPWLVESVLTVR